MAEFQFYNELNPRAKNKKKLKYKSRKMVLSQAQDKTGK